MNVASAFGATTQHVMLLLLCLLYLVYVASLMLGYVSQLGQTVVLGIRNKQLLVMVIY